MPYPDRYAFWKKACLSRMFSFCGSPYCRGPSWALSSEPGYLWPSFPFRRPWEVWIGLLFPRRCRSSWHPLTRWNWSRDHWMGQLAPPFPRIQRRLRARSACMGLFWVLHRWPSPSSLRSFCIRAATRLLLPWPLGPRHRPLSRRLGFSPFLSIPLAPRLGLRYQCLPRPFLARRFYWVDLEDSLRQPPLRPWWRE